MNCTFFCEPVLFPTLGVEYLIAVLRSHGHNVGVVFDSRGFKPWEASNPTTKSDTQLVNNVVKTDCDVLFAYSTTNNFKRLVNIFDLVKASAPNMVIAVGGPHPTYAHEHTIRKKSIDYLCRGEGEIAILQIIDLIEGRRTNLPPGVYRMAGDRIEGQGFGTLVGKLDDLPYPDKSDFFENVPNVRSVYTAAGGRGCYNSCTFCNSPTMRNHYRGEGFQFMRRRSVEDLVRELAVAKEVYKPHLIAFADDVFIYNRRYMLEFAKQYKEHIGIPFGCSTIPDFFHEDVIDALVEAGLSAVDLGVQSLNPDTRLSVFGRTETNEEYSNFVSMLKKRGVYTISDHIINPWDSRENLKQQLVLYSEARPDFINVFHLQYFPDTNVIENAVRDGYLAPDAVDGIAEGNINSYFFGGSIQEVVKSLHDLVVLLSFVPFLPTWLTKLVVNSRLLMLFKVMPSQAVLVLRALNALCRKVDTPGRLYLKVYFLDLLKIKVTVAKDRVQAIREMTSRKSWKPIVPAVPRKRSARQNLDSSSPSVQDSSLVG